MLNKSISPFTYLANLSQPLDSDSLFQTEKAIAMENDEYCKEYEVKWADIDANRHMRHSAYNDYAAQARVSIFTEHGLSMDEIAKMGLGPILFREETKFYREVNLFDKITVTFKVKAMRKDGSRWSVLHEVFKEDGTQAAAITVDGAWIDLQTRRLGKPSEKLLEIFSHFPRTEDFTWEIAGKAWSG